eukprot:Hpha_TRINITY_DN16118_c1_g9::TRINITY_DN16118_c1_g9_i2::g.8249::m.8249
MLPRAPEPIHRLPVVLPRTDSPPLIAHNTVHLDPVHDASRRDLVVYNDPPSCRRPTHHKHKLALLVRTPRGTHALRHGCDGHTHTMPPEVGESVGGVVPGVFAMVRPRDPSLGRLWARPSRPPNIFARALVSVVRRRGGAFSADWFLPLVDTGGVVTRTWSGRRLRVKGPTRHSDRAYEGLPLAREILLIIPSRPRHGCRRRFRLRRWSRGSEVLLLVILPKALVPELPRTVAVSLGVVLPWPRSSKGDTRQELPPLLYVGNAKTDKVILGEGLECLQGGVFVDRKVYRRVEELLQPPLQQELLSRWYPRGHWISNTLPFAVKVLFLHFLRLLIPPPELRHPPPAMPEGGGLVHIPCLVCVLPGARVPKHVRWDTETRRAVNRGPIVPVVPHHPPLPGRLVWVWPGVVPCTRPPPKQPIPPLTRLPSRPVRVLWIVLPRSRRRNSVLFRVMAVLDCHFPTPRTHLVGKFVTFCGIDRPWRLNNPTDRQRPGFLGSDRHQGIFIQLRRHPPSLPSP